MIRPSKTAQRTPPRFAAAANAGKPSRRLPQINHKFAALGAAVVLGVVAFGAIQVFGDPSAAGPRGVISLAPDDADASAPTVSFSDVAEEAVDMQHFGLDELPYAGEIGEIGVDGQLRVSVVEAPSASGGGARRPASP